MIYNNDMNYRWYPPSHYYLLLIDILLWEGVLEYISYLYYYILYIYIIYIYIFLIYII